MVAFRFRRTITNAEGVGVSSLETRKVTGMSEGPEDLGARKQIHAHTHTLDIESLILKEAGFTGKVRDIVDAIIGAAGTRLSPMVFEMDHLTLARRLNHPQARGDEKRDKKAAITYVSRKLNRLEAEMRRTGLMVIRIERGHEEQRTRYEVFITPVAHRAYQRAYASELWKKHPGKAKSAQVAQAIAELPRLPSEEDKQRPKGEPDEKLISRNASTIFSLAQKSFDAIARNGGSPKEHCEVLTSKLSGLAEVSELRAKGAGRRYVIRRDDKPEPPPGEGGIHKSVDTPQDAPILTAALDYAQRGVPVFPTRPDKTPYTKHGFKDAARDEATIRAWWRRWPDAGVGVPTGAASGMFALDVDKRHGGDKALATLEAENSALPPTLTHETGDGCHKIFKYQGDVRLTNSTGGLPDGLDVRAEGGYIVMPPTLHPSGKSYKKLNDLPPAVPPEWLLSLLLMDTNRAETNLRPQTTGEAGTSHLIPYRQRNKTLFKIACAVRGQGGELSDVERAVFEAYDKRCEKFPPMDDAELRKIALSAMRYSPNAAAVA